MMLNFLRLAFRNIWKNKVFVLINIIGLGVALACCIVAYLNWQFNNQFDRIHVNADKIYRVSFVRMTNGRPVKNGSCPAPLGQNISENIPEVEHVIRYMPQGGTFKIGSDVFNTSVTVVDPAFFEVFSFEMIHGTGDQLVDMRAIYISDELADRYFQNMANPVGETLTFLAGDQRTDFRVAGVFRQPPLNSSFQARAYANYGVLEELQGFDPDNWANFNTTFVAIPNTSSVVAIERQLADYVEIQNRVKQDYAVDHYYLDPFKGMAVRSMRDEQWNHWTNQSLPTPAAVAPGIMAMLLLLLACFNFTNTSIAIANRRIKEIGIRKVLGSDRRQLILQFLGENGILALMAMLLGIAIAAYLVPLYSRMWAFLDIELDFFVNPELFIFILALLIATGVLAGSYPAFYISRFEPTTIFRGTVKFSGTSWFTRILLTLQFAISMIAIVSAILFTLNARFQENYDMGFDIRLCLSAWVENESGYNRYRNLLQEYPEIEAISGSQHSLARSWYTDPISYDSRDVDAQILHIGSNYLEAVGATLIAGRNFQDNSMLDAETSIIVNEEMAREYGWNEPVGKRILLRDTIPLNVIGMVKDIYPDGALWVPVQPMMLRLSQPSEYRFLTVSTTEDKVLEVKRIMDAKWKEAFPDQLSTVSTMDEQRAQGLEVNTNIRQMFLFLGMVAVILSMIGLFSLVSLNLNKRMKEIGVRKVHGASIAQLSMRMSREFFTILGIASAIGCVAGFYLAEILMASIWAYHVPAEPWAFVLAIAILLLAGGATILSRIVKVATVNPALILRDE